MDAILESVMKLATPAHPEAYRRYLLGLPRHELCAKLRDLEASGRTDQTNLTDQVRAEQARRSGAVPALRFLGRGRA